MVKTTGLGWSKDSVPKLSKKELNKRIQIQKLKRAEDPGPETLVPIPINFNEVEIGATQTTIYVKKFKVGGSTKPERRKTSSKTFEGSSGGSV